MLLKKGMNVRRMRVRSVIMKVIDMHCDTLSELLGRRERGKAAGLRQNDCHVDLLRMKESRYLLQNFAMFVVLEGFGDPWERVCTLHRYYQEELERNQDILAPVLRFSDIAENEAQGKLSALLTVEEGGVCKGETEKLRELYRMGVRMITLTWNFDNEIGHPNFDAQKKQQMKHVMKTWREYTDGMSASADGASACAAGASASADGTSASAAGTSACAAGASACADGTSACAAGASACAAGASACAAGSAEWEQKRREAQFFVDAYLHTPNLTGGLTGKGREMVAEMEGLGIIPDVSHLSDAGFYDVLEVTKKPFVASHSNARAVCPNVRNMTDDMIRRLAGRGGVMGLNFCADFLEEKPLGEKNPGTVEAVVRHARHIADVGGVEVLGLGSDFDGIDTNEGLPGVQSMEKLWHALHEAGFSEDALDKVFYGNVLRVYRDTLG